MLPIRHISQVLLKQAFCFVGLTQLKILSFLLYGWLRNISFFICFFFWFSFGKQVAMGTDSHSRWCVMECGPPGQFVCIPVFFFLSRLFVCFCSIFQPKWVLQETKAQEGLVRFIWHRVVRSMSVCGCMCVCEVERKESCLLLYALPSVHL